MSPTLLLVASLVSHVAGHGRLMNPPARNAMWRFKFSNPVNYNDNELFCGGFVVHHQHNGGNCGPCGDNYALKVPRPHEAGGKFAQGIIGRRYAPGQLVDIEVDLTANHRGKFAIRLCPHNNDKTRVTQECFNQNPLKVAGTNSYQYSIQNGTGKAGIFRWKVELPPYLTCTQCVMQWTYYSGNTWGTCSDGKLAVGCGPQETFINCADIAIISNTPYFGPVHNSLSDLSYMEEDVDRLVSMEIGETRPAPAPFRPQVCVPHGEFRSSVGAEEHCLRCMHNPERCPTHLCTCITECEAIGGFAKEPQAHLFCHENCLGFPSHCPEDKCRCF